MKIAFFASSLVSAYWNGAATYYRGIVRAMHERGALLFPAMIVVKLPPTKTRPVLSTDILALLQRASDYAHSAHERRTTLLLVSDMLNARKPVPPQAADESLPDPSAQTPDKTSPEPDAAGSGDEHRDD